MELHEPGSLRSSYSFEMCLSLPQSAQTLGAVGLKLHPRELLQIIISCQINANLAHARPTMQCIPLVFKLLHDLGWAVGWPLNQ